jgi:hypothetical protein
MGTFMPPKGRCSELVGQQIGSQENLLTVGISYANDRRQQQYSPVRGRVFARLFAMIRVLE